MSGTRLLLTLIDLIAPGRLHIIVERHFIHFEQPFDAIEILLVIYLDSNVCCDCNLAT
jgi:hypothetical protein